MTLTFPRDMTTGIEWEIADLELVWRQEISRQAGGTAIGKDMGSPIWKANYKTIPLEKADAETVYADFMTLGGVANTFYLHVASRPEPINEQGVDPLSPVIHSIDTDRASFRISGLPTYYGFRHGDYIGVETQAGGLELLYCADVKASGTSDTTGLIHIAGYLRETIDVGDVVNLTPAMVEMRLDVGGLKKPKRVSGNLYAVEFSASQVIR